MKFVFINHILFRTFFYFVERKGRQMFRYFVQDETNFIYPLSQVGSGSGEKSTGSGKAKIPGSVSSPLLISVPGRAARE